MEERGRLYLKVIRGALKQGGKMAQEEEQGVSNKSNLQKMKFHNYSAVKCNYLFQCLFLFYILVQTQPMQAHFPYPK